MWSAALSRTGTMSWHSSGPRAIRGAYTTFSAFSYETVRLLEAGSLGPAVGNALGSVVAGLAAAALGLAVTAAL